MQTHAKGVTGPTHRGIIATGACRCDDPGTFVRRARSLTLDANTLLDRRRASRSYVVAVRQGALTVRCEGGFWFVPGGHAFIASSPVSATLRAHGRCLISLFELQPGALHEVLGRSGCIVVSGMLEMLLAEMEIDTPPGESEDLHLMMTFLVSRIRRAHRPPFGLPVPSDERGIAMVDAILDGIRRPAGRADASLPEASYTRARDMSFRSETGLSIAQWRRKAALLVAACGLFEGMSVAQAAQTARYSRTSAFCQAFRETFGSTPLAFRKAASRSSHTVLPGHCVYG